MSDTPPPTPPPQYTAPYYSSATTTVKDPAGIGKALWISLLIFGAIQGLSGFAHLQRAWVLHRLITGDLQLDSSAVNSADTAVDTLNAINPFISIAVFLCLVIWLYRITKFSRSQGATFARGNGWAIGGFFVPIANLFIPFAFARDNFLHFIRKGLIEEDTINELKFWWIGYIGLTFATRVIEASDQLTLESLRSYDLWSAGVSVLLAAVTVSGVLAIRAICSANNKSALEL